jgi:hypothetical protein
MFLVRLYSRALPKGEVAWLASDGTGYVPLRSPLNIYDGELQYHKAINFRDFAMLLENWLKKKYRPEE